MTEQDAIKLVARHLAAQDRNQEFSHAIWLGEDKLQPLYQHFQKEFNNNPPVDLLQKTRPHWAIHFKVDWDGSPSTNVFSVYEDGSFQEECVL